MYNLLVSYRSGDMWAPKIEATEALKAGSPTSSIAFSSGETPFNDGQAGMRVVKMLEAAEKSLNRKGDAVYV